MIRRSRWSIVLTLLFAVGQLALPAALSISDALASDDGGAMVGHIERAPGTGCRAPHPDDCAVCRYLTMVAAPARAPLVRTIPTGQNDLGTLASAHARAAHLYGFLSRAPPAVTA